MNLETSNKEKHLRVSIKNTEVHLFTGELSEVYLAFKATLLKTFNETSFKTDTDQLV